MYYANGDHGGRDKTEYKIVNSEDSPKQPDVSFLGTGWCYSKKTGCRQKKRETTQSCCLFVDTL